MAPSIKCLNHYNICKGFPKYLSNIQSTCSQFLALLDYVGSLESSWNQNTSIGRPSHGGIDYLWTYCIEFFQTLVVASPEPYLFWNLENKSLWNFHDFFLFRQHGTLWEQKLQSATSPSNHFWIFSNFSWIYYLLFRMFEILSSQFLINIWISPLYPMVKAKTSIICKTSDHREKLSEIWALGVSIQGLFDS